jgi:hypothetical protein
MWVNIKVNWFKGAQMLQSITGNWIHHIESRIRYDQAQKSSSISYTDQYHETV